MAHQSAARSLQSRPSLGRFEAVLPNTDVVLGLAFTSFHMRTVRCEMVGVHWVDAWSSKALTAALNIKDPTETVKWIDLAAPGTERNLL